MSSAAGTNAYEEAHRRSIDDPEGFWGEAAKEIDWYEPWEQVLDASDPPFYRWFKGGTLNTCFNAVDRHVAAGRGDQPAIIHDSPVTGGQVRKITYSDLQDQVSRVAGVLRDAGVAKGDRVIVYMPMVAESLIAMLACARLGAIHSVVFGGFAGKELAVRIDDATPKAIVTASCGIEGSRVIEYLPLLDQALEIAEHAVDACVVLDRPQSPMPEGYDAGGRSKVIDWAAAMAGAAPADCVPVAATDPLYILYTSGTTGKPKGVVRDNGGHAVALKWSMKNVYNVEPGEVYWAASDVGWVVGHSYICYAPLLHGCTTVVFEGKPVGTPDAGAFWRVIAEHGVGTMFTAPTAFRAIKREDPKADLMKRYDLSKFRALFLAGERTDPDTLTWAEDILEGRPVIDHWWQTETAWSIAANCLGLHLLPVKAGSPAKPAPGWDLQVLDETGRPQKPGEIGELVAKLPMAPASMLTLWNADERCKDAYFNEFPGYYKTSDAGIIDEDGYVYVMARTDDIINVAGHRLSTGAMEEVLASHPDVAECAVIGVSDDLKGQLPVGFLVLKAGVTKGTQEIVSEVVALVRERIGPVAAFKSATVVERLPKTRSGKILRGTMQKIADQQTFNMPATIDDPAILGEIEGALKSIGYAGA